MNKILSIFLVSLVPLFFIACGEGGENGDDFVGAGNVNITATPNKIDTGDRTRVSIKLSEINLNGISLKILFPSGLSYVPDSTNLIIDKNTSKIEPNFNISGTGGHFIVYFLAESLFKDKKGEIVLELEGISRFTKGRIDVDVDVDNPLIANADEFDANDPKFTAESSASIEVIS